MSLFSIWHYLWVLRLILQAFLLVLLLRHKFYRSFPLFVLFTAYTIGLTIVLQTMNLSPSVTGYQYFYAYVLGTTISAALSFAVIYEISQHLLRDYPALRHLGANVFRGVTAVLALGAVLLAWSNPAAGLHMIMAKVDVIQQSVSVVQCGLVVFLLLFSGYFGLSLRSETFGIALGFGLMASMNLAIFTLHSLRETLAISATSNLFNMLRNSTSLCAVLVWVAYLRAREPQTYIASTPLPGQDLESWNLELRRLVHRP